MYEKFKTQPEKFLPVLMVISVILRVAVAVALGNEVTELPGTFDQVSYHTLAQRVVDGYGFTFGKNWWPVTAANSPTAHWSFLYTGYLVVVYALTHSPLVARVLQAIIVGILHPYLAYLIGKRVFNTQVGVLAAAITVFYTYFIYYAGTLMTEPFYITAVLGVFYLTIRLADVETTKGGVWLSVGLGLTLGAVLLFRQLFLLFIPFLFLWLAWARRKTGIISTFWFGVITAGVMMIMILPITFYNYSRFHRFVLLNTNAGYAFYLANHPFYGTNFIPARNMKEYQSMIPDELKSLDEAALDQELLKRGLGFVTENPKRYILLSLDRIPEYFKFWPTAESGLVSNLSRITSFGFALPWMLAGLWLWLRAQRKTKFAEILASPGTLLLGFFLVYTGIHIVSWALVRYRLPVDAILIVFAALAVHEAILWIERKAASKQSRSLPA